MTSLFRRFMILAGTAGGLCVTLLLVTPASAAPESIAVAVLPLAGSGGRVTPLEKTTTDFLRQRIGSDPDLRLVPADRTEAVAGELGLSAGAPVRDDDARHLGILAEADVVIAGSTAASGRNITFTARLIGVRTLRSDDVRLEGDRIGRIGPIVSSFGDRVAERLREGREDLAFANPEDLIIAEQGPALADHTLPSLYLSFTEEYDGVRRGESSAERSLAGMLQSLGFDLTTVARNADVVLFAVAKGRPEGRVRSAMISASDVEVRVIDPARGLLLYHETLTHRAVDPFADAAGARAFEEGVLLLARHMLPALVASWQGSPAAP